MIDTTTWRRVLLPTEHGGWAFVGEPILLGLLVAGSPAGVLLAVAALAAFLARQPLKTLALDRRLGRRHARTRVAARALAACVLVAAGASATAMMLARAPFLPALGVMAALASVALAFDLGLRSRHVLAELAGGLALGGLAAAIALAHGWPAGRAFGLWGVLASRVAPSILYVRARLRLERGAPVNRRGPLTAAVFAVLAVAALARAGFAPWLAVISIALLALRAAHGLSGRRIRMRTSRLGLTEVAFGLMNVIAVAVGWALARS